MDISEPRVERVTIPFILETKGVLRSGSVLFYGVEQKKVRFAHKNSPEFQLCERQTKFLVRIWLEHDTHKSSGSE